MSDDDEGVSGEFDLGCGTLIGIAIICYTVLKIVEILAR